MEDKTLRKLIYTAVLAALTCAATLVIHVPTPLGYVNLGDGIALLAGWLLGPRFGFAAAGLGSALADLLLGYITYVPGTFLVKGLIALIGAAMTILLTRHMRPGMLPSLISAVVAELEMVLGYFLYEAVCLSYGAAAAVSIPTNAIQGAAGIAVYLALISLLRRTHLHSI